MALALLAQPDGRRHRRFSLGRQRRKIDNLLARPLREPGSHDHPARYRCLVLSPRGKNFRRRDMSEEQRAKREEKLAKSEAQSGKCVDKAAEDQEKRAER